MDSNSNRGRGKRFAGVAGLLAAGALAGGVMAGTLTASAASSTTNTAANTAAVAAPAARHGATPVRPGEKAISSTTTAQQVRAAALKAVPGGTVYRVETDADGDAYEAHMTKADGSEVTVKFDSNLKVTGVEAGMGGGGHGAGPSTNG